MALSRSAILAIMAVVVVVIAAVSALFFLGIIGGGSSNNGTGSAWHEGDYVEWASAYLVDGQPGDVYGYQRFTVTEVGDPWLTLNLTSMNPARIVLFQQDTHVLANESGFGFAAVSLASIYYNVTLVGTESVDTEWGPLSADHYQYSYNTTGVEYTVDIWVRNGFYLMQKTTAEAGISWMIFISDTNISKITSA